MEGGLVVLFQPDICVDNLYTCVLVNFVKE